MWGGMISESAGGFLHLQKHIPNLYPELLNLFLNDNGGIILIAFNIYIAS